MDPVNAAADPLAGFDRITVKIGSTLLVDDATGALRAEWLRSLAADIAALTADGKQIVVVSSGAIALGCRLLGLDPAGLPLDKSQAAAAVGQIALSQAYRDFLGAHAIITGQILVTPNITEERRYFLNARTTMNTLLALGAVPIINENDSVSTSEIRYGDNDRLSARVAAMIESDALVVLSDVDGLYTAPPDADPDARHVPRVERVTAEIEAMAGGPRSASARGGMRTKLIAARMATEAGTAMIIAKGTDSNPLRALSAGAPHTFFAARLDHAAARKRWIMASIPAGRLTVDAGAADALKRGTSLLPIGVTGVSGDFSRGDAVAIVSPAGEEIARGLAGFDAADARSVAGLQSREIIDMLGRASRTEMVHRDNLVLLAAGKE
ncbi:MAG TPA: glutamate 5-kinase [Devosiaceae bacterium]|nr:glutamate 5-kinase [Devosiaceae bacterium]